MDAAFNFLMTRPFVSRKVQDRLKDGIVEAISGSIYLALLKACLSHGPIFLGFSPHGIHSCTHLSDTASYRFTRDFTLHCH